MDCFRCGEPVTSDDRGVLEVVIGADGPPTERPSHWECQARSVLGSVGHIQGRCSCFGGTEEDPPGMTKREAARAAVAAFRASQRHEIIFELPVDATIDPTDGSRPKRRRRAER